ncbi:MAG TPA: hypothetical protein VLQ79_03910, partial [Myxococcaceae bacterium]|nr:hypothetical protein [Myxococcaceae bacterium]
MTRHLRLFATLAGALALSATVTAGLSRASPRPDQGAASNGVAVAARTPGASPSPVLARSTIATHRASVPGSDYQLERIPVAARVIMQLKDHYVDPSRFHPKEMLVAALESVERKVAE